MDFNNLWIESFIARKDVLQEMKHASSENGLSVASVALLVFVVL